MAKICPMILMSSLSSRTVLLMIQEVCYMVAQQITANLLACTPITLVKCLMS